MKTKSPTLMALGVAGIGAVGTVGSYLFLHPRVRKDMHDAKTNREAMHKLGEHVREDSRSLATRTLRGIHSFVHGLAHPMSN